MDKMNLDKSQCAELKVFRLGQQGYILESGQIKLGIDLYLSESPKRLIANFVEPEELQDLSLLFGSHDHLDHIDRNAWVRAAAACPGLKFVVPAFFEASLPQALGVDKGRFVFVDENRPAEVDGVKICAVAAAHEFLDTDAETGYHPYLCYILEFNGFKIFHGGDTCRYDGFAGKIMKYGTLDIAFLPINGRDAERYARGCIGNMTYQEAVDLAGEIKPKMTIPGHYDMFANNSENPELFCSYLQVKYPGLRFKVLPAGTMYTYKE